MVRAIISHWSVIDEYSIVETPSSWQNQERARSVPIQLNSVLLYSVGQEECRLVGRVKGFGNVLVRASHRSLNR
jgi:hypothetical protein